MCVVCGGACACAGGGHLGDGLLFDVAPANEFVLELLEEAEGLAPARASLLDLLLVLLALLLGLRDQVARGLRLPRVELLLHVLQLLHQILPASRRATKSEESEKCPRVSCRVVGRVCHGGLAYVKWVYMSRARP